MKPTDAEVDRMLDVPIPGGSRARDWFLPHGTKKGLENVREVVRRMVNVVADKSIDMVLHCPACGMQHVDEDNSEQVRIVAAERGYEHGSRDWEAFIERNEWANPPHRSHLCAGCGHVWRPADVCTNGVAAVKTKGKQDSPIPASTLVMRPSPGLTQCDMHDDESC